MRKERGFTMIELIMVIVIIGILSTVAVPKFFDFKSEAGKAAAEGVKGALASGIAMAYAESLLGKDSTGLKFDNGTLVMDNTTCSNLSKVLSTSSDIGTITQITGGGCKVPVDGSDYYVVVNGDSLTVSNA